MNLKIDTMIFAPVIKTIMKKIFQLSMLVMLAQTATAQTPDTLFSKTLTEVIITGQYRPQSVKNSVYQVRSISAEQIRRQGANSLPDILNKQLNIRFSQDLSTGGTSVAMMGMKGQNLKVLIDGLPLTGRQGATNEIDISQVDIHSIERIEIVEGPMSVIYGADALAGVINIITKKASRSPITVSARLHEETVGNEYGITQGIHNQHLSLGGRLKNWELGGAVGRNYFGGWKDTASDRELIWHKKDQLLANGFMGYANGKFRARYRVDGLDEIITNPGNFLSVQQSSGDTLANDQEYLSRRVMHQFKAGYTPNGIWNVQLQSAYTSYSRQVFSTTVSKKTGDTRLDMGTGRQSVVHFTGFTTRVSAVYKFSPLVSVQPGAEIQLDAGEGERLQSGNNQVNDYAFFITSEITPGSKWNIRPGLRFISNSVYQAPPLIPSLNIKYGISRALDLRLAYARGFRSPSLRELYFNFFDANHQILGNPELEAETSHSFTGSLNWNRVTESKSAYTITLGAFYNAVKNGIDYAVSANDPNIYILTNVADAKTAGMNTTISYVRNRWNLSAGAAYTGFYNDYVNTDHTLPQLQWSPEANAAIGYTIREAGLDLNLFYKFTGKRPYYTLTSTQQFERVSQQAYHLADLTITKKACRHFVFSAGIRNLFNVDRIRSTGGTTGIHTASGTTNIASGRSVFAGIIFNWEKNSKTPKL